MSENEASVMLPETLIVDVDLTVQEGLPERRCVSKTIVTTSAQSRREHRGNMTEGSIPKQRQSDKEFSEHKQRVMVNLSSGMCDHSPKGDVDRKCIPLMHLLNVHKDYVTTSSCSGRIALFHSSTVRDDSGEHTGDLPPAALPALKRGSKNALGWLMVKHDVLTEQEIDVLVCALCGDEDSENSMDNSLIVSEKGCEELGGFWAHEGVLNPAHLPGFGMVALKMEPFVMHVECRTMESAKRLLSAAASDSGFRNSGVTPPGKRVMCAIRHAPGLGLDVPLMLDGVNYVKGQHSYVRRLLHLANEKMQHNDVKLQRLKEAVATRLGKQSECA